MAWSMFWADDCNQGQTNGLFNPPSGNARLPRGRPRIRPSALAGPTLTFALNQIPSVLIGTGILGTVVLTQTTSNVVDVEVTLTSNLLNNSGGQHTPFAFNKVLTGLTVNFLTRANGSYASGTFSSNPARLYGSFTDTIDTTAGNGSSHGYTGVLDFTVSRALGISTTDFGSNIGGCYFSADMSNGTSSGSIAALGPSPAPEPAGVLILGSALAGLGVTSRRKKPA